MSSRLDPQPNVAVSALMRGMPTVCLTVRPPPAKSCPLTSRPPAGGSHLDACSGRGDLPSCNDVRRLPRWEARPRGWQVPAYDMARMSTQIGRLGRGRGGGVRPEDLRTLRTDNGWTPSLPSPDEGPGARDGSAVLQQGAVLGPSLPGFQPHSGVLRGSIAAYAQSHPTRVWRKREPLAIGCVLESQTTLVARSIPRA